MKEPHARWAAQAPAWPGPAKDPAWVGLAPEPAQAGRAHEPAWSSLAPEPAQAGHAREPARSRPAPGPAQAGRAPEPAQAGRARKQTRGGHAPGPALAGRARGPVWRALLEARWRDRVQEVTELSLAYHEAASAAAVAAGAGPARHRPVARQSGRCASCCAGRSRPGVRWRTPKKRSAGWPAAGTACARTARAPSRPGCWPPRRRRGIARAAARAPPTPPGLRWPAARRSPTPHSGDDGHRGRQQPGPGHDRPPRLTRPRSARLRQFDVTGPHGYIT